MKPISNAIYLWEGFPFLDAQWSTFPFDCFWHRSSSSWGSVPRTWPFWTALFSRGISIRRGRCIQSHLLWLPTCGTLPRGRAWANSCQPCGWKSFWCLTMSFTKLTISRPLMSWPLWTNSPRSFHCMFGPVWCISRGFRLSLWILRESFWWFRHPWQCWLPLMGMESWDNHDIPNSVARFGCTVWLFCHHWDHVCHWDHVFPTAKNRSDHTALWLVDLG